MYARKQSGFTFPSYLRAAFARAVSACVCACAHRLIIRSSRATFAAEGALCVSCSWPPVRLIGAPPSLARDVSQPVAAALAAAPVAGVGSRRERRRGHTVAAAIAAWCLASAPRGWRGWRSGGAAWAAEWARDSRAASAETRPRWSTMCMRLCARVGSFLPPSITPERPSRALHVRALSSTVTPWERSSCAHARRVRVVRECGGKKRGTEAASRSKEVGGGGVARGVRRLRRRRCSVARQAAWQGAVREPCLA
eukprot:4359529-Prymnesium_polylepis.1